MCSYTAALLHRFSYRDVCVATPGGFRALGQSPWEDRRQPLVPALDKSGHPDGQPADIPGADKQVSTAMHVACASERHILSNTLFLVELPVLPTSAVTCDRCMSSGIRNRS